LRVSACLDGIELGTKKSELSRGGPWTSTRVVSSSLVEAKCKSEREGRELVFLFDVNDGLVWMEGGNMLGYENGIVTSGEPTSDVHERLGRIATLTGSQTTGTLRCEFDGTCVEFESLKGRIDSVRMFYSRYEALGRNIIKSS